MDFFSKALNKNSTSDTSNDTNKTPNEHKPTSTSDLFASAKVLAEAVKGGGEQNKEKIADASGDLLSAASQYGKIDETSTIGKSVHQAEQYLQNYNSSSSPPTSQSATTTNTTNISDSIPSTKTPDSTPDSDGGSQAESGGGYMKMAEGLFKSTKTPDSTPDSDGGSQAESGGGYMKMAEGLFKRN